MLNLKHCFNVSILFICFHLLPNFLLFSFKYRTSIRKLKSFTNGAEMWNLKFQSLRSYQWLQCEHIEVATLPNTSKLVQMVQMMLLLIKLPHYYCPIGENT